MSNELVPIKITDEEESGFSQVSVRMPVAKHQYLAGVWQFNKNPELDAKFGDGKQRDVGRREEVKGAVLYFTGGLRRLYTEKYDPNATEVKPPVCSSLDSISGSRPAEWLPMEGKGGVERKVFGSCGECFFKTFGSKREWFPNEVSGAPLCGEYGLVFVIMDCDNDLNGGVPVILQLPPTGMKIGGKMITAAAAKSTKPDVFLWSFMGCGEKVGNSNSGASVSLIGALSTVGWDKLKELRKKYAQQIQEYVSGFVMGRDLSDIGKPEAGRPSESNEEVGESSI